jgi:hypothetical protein
MLAPKSVHEGVRVQGIQRRQRLARAPDGVRAQVGAAARIPLPAGRRTALTWTLPRRLAPWQAHLASLATYTALSAAMFGPALRGIATSYVGSIPDATQSIWFLSWTAHALSGHHSLLVSDALNAPAGVNLM